MQIGLRALFVYNSVFYSNPKFNQTAKFAVIFVAVSIILATFAIVLHISMAVARPQT